ncbi:NADH:flavin oxidoreductase/NADH oxidase family protein [Bacillus carboniphilus]|uniref:NADH:flavin oxidoreductase/NADH oxidase family protein n=1 Tax=Bacillus carboniphilus TaxID=86663 RepID=A0ABY9JU20_9BACI|nr:NADH:flavin oxidoreductase/NADH oxidase family protein [Bacillus carboniphilus]WLR42896.1 NADH:flavin oxidoreductase/NADH oxidase family protein [Bacillus carboniphilus]
MSSKEALFSPLSLPCGATIKNRFFKAAMSESLANSNYAPSDMHTTLYKRWAEGGAGLILTGNVMIDPSALGEPRNVVVEDEKNFEMLKKWAVAGRKDGAHIWMQINHPGKQTPKFLTKEPVAPSNVPLKGDVEKFFAPPRELLSKEIKEIIGRFAETARIAKKAGFTGVEIHAAHGYLINQFLSPYHNKRHDEWGGSLQNRMRFLVDVYKEMRKQVGETFPIGVKLNSADFQKGGFTQHESLEVIKKLDELGVDLLEISGGNYENQNMIDLQKESTRKREAYFIEFAEKVKEQVDIPLVVTGGFKTEEGMAEALSSGAANMIGIARQMVIQPDLPNQIKQDRFKPYYLDKVKTPLKIFDQSGFSELYWYEYQMKRLGMGKEPKLKLSGTRLLTSTLLSQGLHTFKKRRSS